MIIKELGLKSEDVKRIKSIFKNYSEIEKVIVYGSRAKGNYKPYSDVDITLCGDINLKVLNKLDDELDDLLLPYKFDISVFNQIVNKDLIEHINQVGKIIYSSKILS